MARPRIHNEEMVPVSFYLPKRLMTVDHPEHETRSELVCDLLEKYYQGYAERTGGMKPGESVAVQYNKELEDRMKAFFMTKSLQFFDDNTALEKFKKAFPDTSDEEYDLICRRHEQGLK